MMSYSNQRGGAVLKWILIVLGVLVVAVMGTCYWGYKQVTSGGNTATVMVGTTAERAWTYLTNVDSMATISDSTTTVASTGATELVVGDTLRFRQHGSGSPQQSVIEWVVARLDAPAVRVLSTSVDTSQRAGISRIDSVITVGDSVRISSTLSARGMREQNASDSIGKVGGVVMEGATKLIIGGMRMMSQLELERLKAALEGP